MGVAIDMVSGRSLYKVFFIAAVLLLGATQDAFAAQKMGEVINNLVVSWSGITGVFSAIAYIAGGFLGVSALFKFKDHVDNPVQNPISMGVKRMLAAGMLLSLPWMMVVTRSTLFGTAGAGDNQIQAGGWTDAKLSEGGLDTLVVDLISNIGGPMESLLTVFSYLAGYALLMVGIFRLTRKMEEGPRGPAGFGTIMTFIAAGALISFGDTMGFFTSSLFGDGNLMTKAKIGSDIIGDVTERDKIQKVIEGIMAFIMIVGYIAFIRGWFVLKNFADGGQQNATLAQGLTFLFGGALAINLGELVNALQETVGVAGITFV